MSTLSAEFKEALNQPLTKVAIAFTMAEIQSLSAALDRVATENKFNKQERKVVTVVQATIMSRFADLTEEFKKAKA
jgi:hypothetical protein